MNGTENVNNSSEQIKDPETNIDREHERILNEIETTDTAFIGASLRAVYEGNDHQNFLTRLDSRIKQHDKDIEKMCNFHYQGFIESITELINVRGDAEKLKSQTLQINKELHESGKEVMLKNDTLIQTRIQQKNLNSAVESLTACLPVLRMYGKVCEQMKEERYYAALKSLEQLEVSYLPQIHKYRFCQIMEKNIPTIRDTIREKSKKLLNDFLENVRKNSSKIGNVAMKQVEEERDLDEKVQEADELYLKLEKDAKLRNEACSQALNSQATNKNPFGNTEETISNGIENPFENGHESTNPFEDDEKDLDEKNPFTNEDNIVKSEKSIENTKQSNHECSNGLSSTDTSQDLSASDIVDFSPVYKCLHIFGLIKSRDWFEDYYRKQRHKQVQLILEKSTGHLGSVESYKKMFHEIVGFFVVEDHIFHTAQNLVTQKHIDGLWDQVLLHLLNKLAPSQINFPDAPSMMKVKNIIVVFADTLKAYGFSVDRLFGLLMEMRDTYGEMMLKLWQERFEQVFNEDNYTPIYLESLQNIDETLRAFPYDFEGSIYPKTLPFSLFVPKIYNEIKEFILACLKYCEDLHLSSTEVDDMIRKSTNLLLTRTLASGLKTLVQKPSLGLIQLVQITVNTTCLENACPHVEDYMKRITGVQGGSAHSAKLVSVSTFKDARNETESQIYEKLNGKIDEFFDLAEYKWDMGEAEGSASRYLVDLINFLRTQFIVFTNLPENVAQTACMSACKHISSRLTQILLDPTVKSITMNALQQFNLDVVQCEHFANSEPVPGFVEETLELTFVEIRQLLDLILTWDWTSYFADYGTAKSKYLRVNPSRALNVFEKIKQDKSGPKAILSSFMGNNQKKKVNDQVYKRLRSLVSESAYDQVENDEPEQNTGGRWSRFLNNILPDENRKS